MSAAPDQTNFGRFSHRREFWSKRKLISNKNMKMCVQGKGLLFNFSILWLFLYFSPIQLGFIQKWDAPLFYLSDSSEFLIWAHLQIKLNIQHILHKLDMMMMMKIVWYLDDNDDDDENEKAKDDGAHSADCCASMLRCWFQRVEKPCKIKFKYKGRSLRDQIQIQMIPNVQLQVQIK